MAGVDLDTVIKRIDQKIKSLEQTKRVLLEEFGRNEVLPFLKEHKAGTMTSKEKIAELIRTEGPLRRKDIERKTGLKHGTLSFALNDRKLFYHEGGLWYLRGGGQEEKE